jgi:hypothetical protein
MDHPELKDVNIRDINLLKENNAHDSLPRKRCNFTAIAVQ